MAKSTKRKLLESTIAEHVKRDSLSNEQQKTLGKQLLNIVDGDASGIFDSSSAKQIPAIIALTYEYQLDRTTSPELSDEAAQLRSLAQRASIYLEGDQASALEVGIALGRALERFVYDSGPWPVTQAKHSDAIKNLKGGRGKRHPNSQVRKAEIAAFIKELIRADVSREDVILRAKAKYRLEESTLEKYYYRPVKRAVDGAKQAK